jgi:hypothetical protein
MAAKKTAKKAPAKRGPGRPSKYSPALAAKICAQLAQGKSLRTVCKPASMPSCVTVFAWMPKYPDFLKQYEEAVSQRTDAHIEEMLDIADNGKEDAQRSRLRIDTRKWIASKLKPRKYGDKLEIGTDPDQPPIVKIQHEVL